MEMPNRFTVRKVCHRDRQLSYWIFTPDSKVHLPAVNVLRHYSASSQRTYAYCLVDHLNWAYLNGKTANSLTLEDLQRYMHGVTGQSEGVYGVAWRTPEQGSIGSSAASNTATIVKAYYMNLLACGDVNPRLAQELSAAESSGRPRGTGRWREINPLSPRKITRRPRSLADETVAALFEPGVLVNARDVMIVTWLHDGGLRVGGLCGLRMQDLHLARHHPCGQRADPHIHIVGRDDNPNGARAKSRVRDEGVSRDGYVVDGVIRAVSPDMISTFYAYLLDEYHPVQHLVDHEQVLVHVNGRSPGAALTTSAVRKMLRRSCERALFDSYITPHAFRHKAAAALYAASDFNAELVAQEFGWSNPTMVTDLYGKSANRHALVYLQQAWDATAGPASEIYLSTTEDAQ